MARQPITEIGVCSLIIAICATLLWQTLSLPPGSFEPLGSAPVPQVTATIIILSCLAVMIRAIMQLLRETSWGAQLHSEFVGRSPYGVVVMLGGTLIYVALLHFAEFPFGLLTFVFLFLIIWLLEDMQKKAILPAVITSAVVAFGCEYLFTQVFVVDLPT